MTNPHLRCQKEDSVQEDKSGTEYRTWVQLKAQLSSQEAETQKESIDNLMRSRLKSINSKKRMEKKSELFTVQVDGTVYVLASTEHGVCYGEHLGQFPTQTTR